MESEMIMKVKPRSAENSCRQPTASTMTVGVTQKTRAPTVRYIHHREISRDP
jgi:hypothetical protein